MGNSSSVHSRRPVNEHIAANDPELQNYHNYGYIDDNGSIKKKPQDIYVIDGFNSSIKKTRPASDADDVSFQDIPLPPAPTPQFPRTANPHCQDVITSGIDAPNNGGSDDVNAGADVDNVGDTRRSDEEVSSVNIIEYIRRSFRRKRTLSVGDLPRSVKQANNSETNEVFNDEQDKFLLGRAESRDGRAARSEKDSLDRSSTLRRSIRLIQVAPSNLSVYEDEQYQDEKWKIPIDNFTSKKQGPDYKQHSKRMRSYYKAQDELIESFEEIQLKIDDAMENREEVVKLRKQASCYAKMTFTLNLLLLVAKTVASVMSGSIAIISSLVDSAVDLVSGIVLWWTNHAVKRRNIYAYPQGRTKLEPIAIVIISVVMALASLQLIRESIERIASLSSFSLDLPNMEIPTMIIAGSTVVIKFIMWLLCRRINSPSVQALAQDHRNDVLSNTVALTCGYLGSMEMFEKTGMFGFSFVDPAGAIIISMYIVYNWWRTGKEQIKLLTGHSAEPEFLSKLTWLSVNHHPKVLHIDTVRAFHFGNNFLVEVDIVLPETMRLKEAHDIGESLQQKLETFPDVERAFVHLDYEYNHSPSSEHKTV